MKNSILEKFTEKELEDLLSSSRSFKNFLEKVGYYTTGSGAYNSAKKYLNSKFIKIPTYNYVSVFYGKTKNEDFFTENSTIDRTTIKRRIIKEKLIDYKCAKCFNEGIWNNEEMTLELDHINGINNDNRLENLCFLCPNCHSQTNTNSGRNKKVKKKEFLCDCGNKMYKKSNKCNECYGKDKFLQRKVLNRPELNVLL